MNKIQKGHLSWRQGCLFSKHINIHASQQNKNILPPPKKKEIITYKSFLKKLVVEIETISTPGRRNLIEYKYKEHHLHFTGNKTNQSSTLQIASITEDVKMDFSTQKDK